MKELENREMDRKSRAKSRRSRTNKSRGSNESHKSNKTHKTHKSHKSNKTSKSQVRQSKSEAGLSNAGGEQRKEGDMEFDRGSLENGNPHTKVIGKKFLSGFKKHRMYIEALKFSDFKKIPFGNGGYPDIAIDVFKYLTLFDLADHFK